MKTAILKSTGVRSVAFVILVHAISDVRAQSRRSIELNENAFALAAQLIKHGHFVADGKGAWTKHRPSADEENQFIRTHGFSEYAKWHMGIDKRFSENTKQRYKFPYGDFENVHRCGLLAVRVRAREYDYGEIENAAAELEHAIKNKLLPDTDSSTPKKELTLPGS